MHHPPGYFFIPSKVAKPLCWAVTLILLSCATHPIKPTAPAARWYKGNTHSHTVLCGHADSSPEEVARWYHDHGYHFLILSEHNIFINPDSVMLPADKRTDFILIPGEEVTGAQHIHTTGMNTRRFVSAQLPEGFMDQGTPSTREAKRRILQMHVDSILQADGTPILNHPNYVSGIHAEDMLHIRRLHLFELFNGHPAVHNWGNELHASTEQKWDSLLTAGLLLYGVSSDDAHAFKEWGLRNSNPGRGWIMVRSDALNPDAITQSIKQGNFYASNGVILSEVSYHNKLYRVQIDTAQTRRELASSFVTGKISDTGTVGYLIEFIGPNGRVLKSVPGIQSDYKLGNGVAYVRAKISYTRRNPNGSFEQFFAWAQPWFSDGRNQIAD